MDHMELPQFSPLEGDIKTDVLIIGGGLAGLLCAYRLKRAGVDCVLVEADRICGGVSGLTTAKITTQHGLIGKKLLKQFGPERARMYFDANRTALEEYARLCSQIACDFAFRDSYVYATGSTRSLDEELLALEELDVPAEFVRKVNLPLKTAGAVRFSGQAQFHPLKFVAGILPDLRIYENTKVLAYEGNHSVLTNRGRITADKIIVATHFPMFNKHGSYFLKLYQHRSYVLALKNAGKVDGMYVDQSKKGLSFRMAGEFLLLGGGSHRTGKQGGNWEQLRTFAEKTWPDAREGFHWATQDCMSLDGVPYIGQYAMTTPNLYVATGFNKWGMTSSMVAAMILTDLVQGKENAWADVFSPSRSMLRPQLLVNGWESASHLLSLKKPRCSHMGCALNWNPQERTWDCPCHGSRFEADGKLINNPANDDMKG